MSGLLVKSTVIMKEDLVTLNERGLAPPVILGGAALNRRYVEEDLRAIYQGQLFYGEDAFDGLRIMDELAAARSGCGRRQRGAAGVVESARSRRRSRSPIAKAGSPTSRDCCPTHATAGAAAAVADAAAGPGHARRRRSWAAGSHRHSTCADVFAYLNELTLFSTQWQFRKSGVDAGRVRAADARGRPPGPRTAEGAVPGREHPPPGRRPTASSRARADGDDADRLRGRPPTPRGCGSPSRGRTTATSSA